MSDENPTRRKTLSLLVGAGSCAIGAALGAPAIVFVTGPARIVNDTSARWVKVAKMSALKDGAPVKVAVVSDEKDAWSVAKNVELGAIWIQKNAGKVQVFSCVCPHLGCAVQSDEKGYACPCHDSRFDENGKKESGPAPRDLDSLDTKIEGDDLLVNFRRFRVGSEDKEVIG